MPLKISFQSRPTGPRVRSFTTSVASRVFFNCLALTLLVTKVVANHHDATITTNNFALVANLLHAWFYLHDRPSFFNFLSLALKNYL